jgi:methylmalonyl-CoA mutase, N-terminal domain
MIREGQQALAIALDLPTQLGIDPDHELAKGEIGRVGVSIAALRDLDALFAGIPLDAVRQISTTANSIGPVMTALFLGLAERRNVGADSFSVRLQNDVLKEYVARGTQILPPEPAAELVVDTIEYCVRARPGWVPLCVSGYHIRDAGASRAQELGFTLANAREYLSRAERRGISATDVARSVTWFMAASSQPIHEAAKFRAARELWARMLSEDFGVRDEQALRLRIVAYTLGSELSPVEIENNSVRVTLAALGAVLGGVQVLFCSSIDEALGLPSDRNALLSVRTQQVIQRESGVGEWVDSLGGARVVEGLTTDLVDEARSIEADVQGRGGSVEAISSGWMRAEIDREAWEKEERRREAPPIGDSSSVDTTLSLFRIAPEVEERRLQDFDAWKNARDGSRLRQSLEDLRTVVVRNENVVESLREAFLADVTLGEAMDVLRLELGVAEGRHATLGG